MAIDIDAFSAIADRKALEDKAKAEQPQQPVQQPTQPQQVQPRQAVQRQPTQPQVAPQASQEAAVTPNPSQQVERPAFDIQSFIDAAGRDGATKAPPAEDNKIASLEAHSVDAGEALKKQRDTLLRDEELKTLLGKVNPSTIEAISKGSSVPRTPGGTLIGTTKESEAALAGLKERGFSIEDIASAKSFERSLLPPSKKIQQAAGTVAGIAVPAAINLIPGLAAAPEEMITVPLITRTLAKLGLRSGGVGIAGAIGAIGDVAVDPDRDLTVENAFESAKQGLIEEGSVEAIFSAGEMGIARMFGRSGRMATADIDRLNDILSEAAERNGIKQQIRLLPGQASQLPSAQVVEAIAESSLFGANPVAKTKRLTRKAAVNLVDELPETIAKGTSSLSARNVTNAVKDVLIGNESFHSQAAQSIYNRAFQLIDEAGEGLASVTKTVKTPAGKLLSETGQPLVKAGTKEVVEQVPKSGLFADLADVKRVGEKLKADFAAAQGFGYEGKVKSLIEKAANVSDTTSVRGIQKMRSEVLSIQRDLQKSANPNSSLSKVAGELVPVLNKTMEAAADAASGDAKRLLLRANKLWKSNAQTFDNKVIQSIIGTAADTNPKAVFDIINSADEQQVDALLKGLTRKVNGKDVVDSALINKVKGGYLAGMISEVSPEDAFKKLGEGEPVGNVLLKKFNEIPKQVRDRLFTTTEQTDVVDKFRLLSLSQKSGDAGLVGLKFAQTLGVFGLAAAPFSETQRKKLGVTGGALTIGPSVLAGLLLRRPGFARALAEGSTLKATSREGIKVAGRLGKMILDERKRIYKQRELVDKSLEDNESNKKPTSKTDLSGFGGRGY